MKTIKIEPKMTFCAWLQIAFICFKVTDQIDWSWWWVFIPTYIEMFVNVLIAINSHGTRDMY